MPVVLDNLCQGHREAVPGDAELVLADIRDGDSLDEALPRLKIDAVMHLAAEVSVTHSMTDPDRYFSTNIIGGITLLEAMLKHGIHRLVFSSSAAVYGEPEQVPIEEAHSQKPVNAYGESKLMFERLLEWYGKAYGIKHISLRYFNAAGASRLLGEDHRPETHLIPNILQAALDTHSVIPIFGTDYPTRDGSCIRDYVHVVDIARAHLLCLEKLDKLSGQVYNLGNGGGYSVIEVIETARRIAGVNIQAKPGPRRPGDPTILVANSRKAEEELGWSPEFPELESIIESAWEWMRRHPKGWGDISSH